MKKWLLTINSTTPRRFCTGNEPLSAGEYDGNAYGVRRMVVLESFSYGGKNDMNGKISIDNSDGDISDILYSDGLVGLTVDIEEIELSGGSWSSVLSVSFTIVDFDSQREDEEFHLAIGRINRSRAGWIGDRNCPHRVFKQGWCGSTDAATTCDRTFANCTDTDAFCGLRWAINGGESIMIGLTKAIKIGGGIKQVEIDPVYRDGPNRGRVSGTGRAALRPPPRTSGRRV